MLTEICNTDIYKIGDSDIQAKNSFIVLGHSKCRRAEKIIVLHSILIVDEMSPIENRVSRKLKPYFPTLIMSRGLGDDGSSLLQPNLTLIKSDGDPLAPCIMQTICSLGSNSGLACQKPSLGTVKLSLGHGSLETCSLSNITQIKVLRLKLWHGVAWTTAHTMTDMSREKNVSIFIVVSRGASGYISKVAVVALRPNPTYMSLAFLSARKDLISIGKWVGMA